MRAKFGRDPTFVSKKVSFKFISRYWYSSAICEGEKIEFDLSSSGLRTFGFDVV